MTNKLDPKVRKKLDKYFDLKAQAKKIEDQMEELKADFKPHIEEGQVFVTSSGEAYEWQEYTQTRTAWKELHEDALKLADDELQVILGEKKEERTSKNGPFYRWQPMRPSGKKKGKK